MLARIAQRLLDDNPKDLLIHHHSTLPIAAQCLALSLAIDPFDHGRAIATEEPLEHRTQLAARLLAHVSATLQLNEQLPPVLHGRASQHTVRGARQRFCERLSGQAMGEKRWAMCSAMSEAAVACAVALAPAPS